jgi:hypothetical protein
MKVKLLCSLSLLMFLLVVGGCDNNRSRKKSAAAVSPDSASPKQESEGAEEKSDLLKQSPVRGDVTSKANLLKTQNAKGQSRLSRLQVQHLPEHFQVHQKLVSGQNFTVENFVPNKGEKAFELTVACVSPTKKVGKLKYQAHALELSAGNDVVLSVVPETQMSTEKKYVLVSCSEKVTPNTKSRSSSKSKSKTQPESKALTQTQKDVSLLSLDTRTHMVSAVLIEKNRPLSLVSCVRDIVTLSQYADYSFEGGVMILQDSEVVVKNDTLHTLKKKPLKVVCKI